ncbi:MAG: hypothetical protein ACYDHN_16020 [Solirubrobacteraceae bacterium]
MSESAITETPTANGDVSPAVSVGASSRARDIEYVATFHPGPKTPLPAAFAQSCKQLSDGLGLPLWLLVQNTNDRDDPLGNLNVTIRNAFFARGMNLRHAMVRRY